VKRYRGLGFRVSGAKEGFRVFQATGLGLTAGYVELEVGLRAYCLGFRV